MGLGQYQGPGGPGGGELVKSFGNNRQTGIGADADRFLNAALTRALGDERGRLLLSRIVGAGGSVQELAWKEPAEVAALLKEEHPQLVAALLVQLDRAHAAATLEWLPEGQRQEVLRRLAEWQGAPAEALRELEEWLTHRLQDEESESEGAGLAADLLSRMSPAARPWPDDPWNAQPTRKTKSKKESGL